mmetsp:Transcript_37052/g.98561  ORF Transcript_37052/g.98561 Transcript_37052/m.98561 type:complete len:112 (-) Transcript_37052:6044-6379(-)
MVSKKTFRIFLVSSYIRPDILFTPPRLANLLIAGLVIPCILSFSTFLCLFVPPFPRDFPFFPLLETIFKLYKITKRTFASDMFKNCICKVRWQKQKYSNKKLLKICYLKKN